MGQRLIISEEERMKILNMYILNENIFGGLISKFKNSSIYQKVEKAYSPNVGEFVNNIIKEIPELNKVKTQLTNKINQLSKMGDDEKQKLVQQNSNELEKNIKTIETTINEQMSLIFTFLTVIGLLYIIVGLSTQKSKKAKEENERKRKEEEERQRQENERQRQENERQRQENEKLKYKEQNSLLEQTFVGKTLNLYNNVSQQTINSDFSPFTITKIEFKQINQGLKGVVIKGSSKESIEGLLGGNLVAICKTNPDEFSNIMGVFNLFGNDKQKTFYNKVFTTKLNEIGSQWCAKPRADFGSIKNSNVSNLA